MKKNILKGTAFLLVLVMMCCLISACGGSAKMEAPATASSAPAASFNGNMKGESAYENGWYVTDEEWDMPAEAPAAPASSESAGGIDSTRNDVLDKANVKLIYRASMSIQTREFEETQKAIRQLVDAMGGWYETNESYYGGYYNYYGSNLRNAYYTVRIPASKYSEFLTAVGDSCHVVNLSQSVEDVSLAYSDIEHRLETLNTKHDRLIELLSKATEMKDIIELENALSECEYQIDNYSQSKNRYDSLIGYSTVNIDLSEVAQLSDSVVEDQSFSARLGRTFKRGIDNFLEGLDDFVMWLSYNLIGIIFILIIAAVVIRIIRSFSDPDRKMARAAKKAEKKARKDAEREAKRGGASPFKAEQPNVDLTENKTYVSDSEEK